MLPSPPFAFAPLSGVTGSGFRTGTAVGNLEPGRLVGLDPEPDLEPGLGVGLALGFGLVVVGLVLELGLVVVGLALGLCLVVVGLVLRPALVVGLVLGLSTLPCLTTGPGPAPPMDNVTLLVGGRVCW
jgi:hypothetical protein